MQSGFSIHFLQLSGPEAELQAAAAGAPTPQHQQQQVEGLGTGDTGAVAFLAMLKAMGNASNITYDAFAAGGLAQSVFQGSPLCPYMP
jgi:hypothetical protein